MEFIKNFRFIDSIAFFIIFRALYTGVKYGLLSECIKLSAVFIASFFSFQYYPLLLKKFESDVFTQKYLYPFSFCILFVAFIFLFFILRKIVIFLVRSEKPGRAQRWSAVPSALIRSAVFLSAVMFCFQLAPFKKNPFEGSMSERFLKNVAPRSYMFSFGIYKKLKPGAEKNKEVVKYYEVQNILRRDSKKGNRSRSSK